MRSASPLPAGIGNLAAVLLASLRLPPAGSESLRSVAEMLGPSDATSVRLTPIGRSADTAGPNPCKAGITPSELTMHRVLLLVGFAIAFTQHSLLGQASPVALSRQVFVAESSFAATMARRDLRAFAEFVSPEAVFFGDTSTMRGKAAVIKVWQRFFTDPKPPFSWRPETVEVLPSGTLALTSGPVHDPGGKVVGTFTSIWRREADGGWRIVFDKGCPPPPRP